MKKDKSVVKYLQSVAEQEAQEASELFNVSFAKPVLFNHALVIPAYKESVEFIKRFCKSSNAQQQVLLIVVINQPDTCVDRFLQSSLYQQAKQQGECVFETPSLCLLKIDKTNSMMLLVNRFDKPIDANKGVGLARKVGADIAIRLIHEQIVTSRWVYSTDADAHLPQDYFFPLGHYPDKYVAACFDFFHSSENAAVHQANQQYEKALRYYVAGLKYAKSHYAFFTIGSTLAFDYRAYCMSRGFPTRAAGEDFYLLNKVAKLGDVAFVKDVQIKIDARTSDRVPFGTGPAVSQIMTLQSEHLSYYYYHPQVFVELKHFIDNWQNLYQYRDDLKPWLESLSKTTQHALELIGFHSFIYKHKTDKSIQFHKQVKIWFDAFKTLKFIHHVRDYAFADIPLEQAINTAPFDVNISNQQTK